MGITRDSYHKRRSTGGRRVAIHKKRKFELGRQAANTKLGEKRISTVRTRGGSTKYRALRLDSGNFVWASEHCARKTRVIDVVYNPTNQELVRTNTLTKGAIVQVDATPYRQFYATKYNSLMGVKKGKAASTAETDILNRSKSKHLERKLAARKPSSKIDPKVAELSATGRLYARISSRPGQSGRCDGVILEGKELEFYMKRMIKK